MCTCYVLTAEKIILNYFALNPDKNIISFETFISVSGFVGRECNNAILLEEDGDSIRHAVYNRRLFLEINSGEAAVRLIQKKESYSFLKNIDIFNQGMPLSVLNALKEACAQ